MVQTFPLCPDLAATGLPPTRSQSERAAAHLLPSWLGDECVHRSHRSALPARAPEHHGAYFPDETAAEGHHWPV